MSRGTSPRDRFSSRSLSSAGKISTHRRSVPLVRQASPCKRYPPVPTCRMFADFTDVKDTRGRYAHKRKRAHGILVTTRPPEIRTKPAASRNAYSHSHWPRWRRPPTIESSSNSLAQQLCRSALSRHALSRAFRVLLRA